MMRANLSIAIVEMSEKYDWPSSSKGMYLSAFFWGYITTQLVGGVSARRFGPKVMMGLVILVPSLFTLAIPYVAHRSDIALVACRVMIGVAAGPTFPSMYLMLAQWIPPSEKATALSIALAGSSAGTIFIDTVGPVIIHHWGWQYVFFFSGGIGFVWLFFWVFTVADSPAKMGNIHDNEVQYILGSQENAKLIDSVNSKSYSVIVTEEPKQIPNEPPSEKQQPHVQAGASIGNLAALKILSTKASFWVIVFNGLCLNWAYYIFLTWLPTYVHTVLGFDLQLSGIIAITPYISSAIVGFISGKSCDMMIAAGFRLIVVRKMNFFLGCIFYMFCLAALAYKTQLSLSPVLAAVILAVGTAGGGFHVPGYSANIFDIAPNHASIVVGVQNTFATVPGIVGVYSTGYFLQNRSEQEGWEVIWLLAAGFYGMALTTNLIFADVKRLV